ncbi:MAG TPA: hypothetical protein VIK71_03770 [Flavobacteriales bacterium]|jgi:hypothetical protein
MKRIIILVMCIMIYSFTSACDACGCAGGGDGWGIMPNYNRHYAGLRFQYRYFHNAHQDLHSILPNTVTGTDHFFRSDVLVRFALTERWQLTAILPYRYTNRTEEGLNTIQKGIGDASLYLQHLLIKPGENNWKHALQWNVGMKAPTGKFEFSHEVPSTLQNGTGTWDWVVGMNYTLRNARWGINTEVAYRFNGHTTGGYDWGNSHSELLKIFYAKMKEEITILPWLGISSEYYGSNLENMKYQIRAAYTGGYLLNGLLGIDMYSPSVMFGVEAGQAIVNELSEGSSKQKWHFGARFIYFINKSN